MKLLQKLYYYPDPVIFLYLFATMLQGPLLQQYVYSRYSEDNGLTYNYSSSTTCSEIDLNDTKQHDARVHVQDLSARYNIASSLFLTVPSIITCLFYGALSDKIGRKPILLLSIVGGILDSVIVTMTAWFKLPVYLIYVGNFVNGLSGGYTNLVMSSFAYVADTTPRSGLSVRLSFLQCFVFLGMMASVFSSGVFIIDLGFVYPNLINLILKLISFFWLLFVIKESLGYNHEVSESQEPTNSYKELKNIHKQPVIMWKTFTKERPNRAALFVCFFVNMFDYCFTVGMFPVVSLYFMNEPFCWAPLDIGYYEGTSLLGIGIGTAVGVKVGLKLGASESVLGLVSLLICAGYFVMLVFVKTRTIAFAGLALKALSGLPAPIFRSIMSRMVCEDEQGAIFSMVSSSQMLMVFLSTFLFNATYSKLNKADKPNLFWYVPTASMFVPILLVVWYWYLIRNEKPTYNELDERQKEINNSENLKI